MSNWFDSDTRAPRAVAYDRAIAWCLAGFTFTAYLLTYTGIIQSSDGLAMFATAESMARRGEIDSNQLLWMGAQQGNLGPDGELYSRKGVGMTLLAVPLVWIALHWSAIGLVQTALLLNPILTAWTAGLVYLTGRRLDWTPMVSLLTALAFALGTFVWPYTQTFFSDPVCMWGLYAAAYGLLAHAQSGRKRYLFAAAIAWSIAYLARVVNLVTLPLYAAAFIAAVLWASRTQDGRIRIGPWVRLPLTLWRNAWRSVITFVLPILLAGLFSLYWNWVRYGNIWDSGYVETERFSAIWWFGVGGLLVGPARGFFWYSPILLLALWGGVLLWRRTRAVALFCLILSVGYVLLYGKWYMWHGGYSWGPRFLVPVVPFVAVLAGAAMVRLLEKPNRLYLWGVGLLGAVSFAVQWLGLLAPFGLVQDWLDATIQPLFAPETFTRLPYSPLVLQWQFLQPEHFIILWMRSMLQWDWRMGTLVVFLLFLLVAGALLLVRQVRGASRWIPVDSRRLELASDGWEAAARPYVLGVGAATVMLLITVFFATGNTDQRVIAQRVAAMEAPGDAILHLRPDATQTFANGYHGRLPVYGHRDGAELDADRQAWQQVLGETHRRIWVVAGSSSAEQSAWELHLRGDDFLLYNFRPSQPDAARLVLFAPSRLQPLQEAGLGTVFGDPAVSPAPISPQDGWFRLSGYGLTPETEAGGELLLALRWETLQAVDYDYHVFVHLLNAAGDRVAQRDGQPVQWLRPTSSWQPGEEIIDRYGLLLSPDLPAGDYSIAVGLYDPVTGQRLPVSAGPSNYAIELGPIVVRQGS